MRAGSLLSFVLGASTAVTPERSNLVRGTGSCRATKATTASSTTNIKLLVAGGYAGTILAVDFDGQSRLSVTANSSVYVGTSFSWVTYRESDRTIFAVNELANLTRSFRLDKTSGDFMLLRQVNASLGVVHLGLSPDGRRMAGAAYGGGGVDLYDVSGRDGGMILLGSVPSPGGPGSDPDRQAAPHPHQAQFDPSGRFVVVTDLGTDEVWVIDAENDTAPRVVSRLRMPVAGCGPRHAVFHPPGAAPARHLFLVCEMGNVLVVLRAGYTADALTWRYVSSQSTFGPAGAPDGAAAGEIQISPDGRHVYVSNRLTGGAADSIAHFRVRADAGADASVAVALDFAGSVSSGGVLPRMFSIANDGRFVFVANMNGTSGLLALPRDSATGILAEPVAALPMDTFGPQGFGPQFVQQIE